MNVMKFSGIQRTSLIDFPDKVAAVLFMPGCNLRCPYCYNWRIVLNPKPPFINEGVALQTLEERKKYVDAVVLTGGEPTIHRELPKFLKKLKDAGFVVKLDTNGFLPQVFEECLPYLDYVALDVKTSSEKYARLGAKDVINLLRTIKILKDNGVKHEFRTTVVPSFVDADDIPKIGEMVEGAENFAFQQFIPGDTLDESFRTLKPYPPETIKGFAESMKKYVKNVVLRM